MRLPGPVALADTLHGGQAFRWRQEPDGRWVGAVGARLVALRAEADGGIRAESWPPKPRGDLARYLGLDAAQEAARARLAKDPVLAPALAAHPGLRLLRQDPWEALVAFVTSANNHVLRIEGILRRVAAKWGPPLASDDGALRDHAFPPPERLARSREETLRALGLGYRAPFVRGAARLVARGEVDLASLRGAPLDEAREALLGLPGVGPKVADCVALFGLGCGGAFPVDRWVARAMAETFFGGRERAPREVVEFARARWGGDAGLAQQFLFHAARRREGAPGTRRMGEAAASKPLHGRDAPARGAGAGSAT